MLQPPCPDEETLLAFAERVRQAPPERREPVRNVRSEAESKSHPNPHDDGLLNEHLDRCAPCREAVSAAIRWARSTPGLPELSPPGVGPPLREGDRVGRYLVQSPLGSGGMGVVYAAVDPELQRRVALKLLRSGSADTRELEERLRREALALARLSHPNVLAVHDVGTHDGEVFLALELIDGQTLEAWLSEQARPWREILAMFQQAGEGLAAAHAAHIVHRDVKPQNILVGEDGRARVTDFGLAATGSPQAAGTLEPPPPAHAGAITRFPLGTPAFMSPEQRAGKPVDERSDQFSFCVALYSGLYGQPPFPPLEPGPPAKPPPNSKVPMRIWRALERGLQREPEHRFVSMRALLAELARAPERRRARALQLLAAAGLAAVLTIVIVRTLEVRASACAPSAPLLAAAWNPQRASTVKQAFTATGLGYAEDAFARAAARLDAYAQSWAAAREETCREPASAPARATRLSCLDERLDELDALARVLGEADRKTVENAVQAAEALPPLDSCANASKRPGGSAQALLRKQLAEIRALQLSGGWKQGLEKAQALTARANAAEARTIALEAQVYAGELQSLLGNFAESRQTLWKTLRAALAVSQQDIAGRAAGKLASTVGLRLGQLEEGERLAELAESLSAPSADGLFSANLLQTQGMISWKLGRLDEAQQRLERALALKRRSLPPHHPEIGNALENLALVEGALGHYRAELAAHEASVALFEERLGPEHPYVAASLGNAGMTLSLLGRAAEAVPLQRRAVALSQAGLGPSHPMVGQHLNNLGLTLGRAGKWEEALTHFDASLRIKEKNLPPEHPDIASTLQNQCEALRQLRRLSEARAPCDRALEIQLRARGTEHPATASTVSLIAQLDQASGKLDRAERGYSRALEMLRKKLGEKHPDLVRPLLGLSELALRRGESARAESTASQAVSILEGTEISGAELDEARALLRRVRGKS